MLFETRKKTAKSSELAQHADQGSARFRTWRGVYKSQLIIISSIQLEAGSYLDLADKERTIVASINCIMKVNYYISLESLLKIALNG